MIRNEERDFGSGSESIICDIRVVTFDLDNTLWNTTATIQAANDALADFMNEIIPGNTLRVESVMGMLYTADKARYAPLDTEKASSPVLLTNLRKDAIRFVLEQSVDDDERIDSLVEEGFEVWSRARHEIIPSHFAQSVVQCLDEIRSLRTRDDTPVLIGAVTDGNSDPRNIERISKYFDFCVNAEMVGVSKPDKRIYLRAASEVIQHPSLHDMIRTKSSFTAAFEEGRLTDTVLETLIGPWWVHIGDDFLKDIVAAKNLNMRSIWSRELIQNKVARADGDKRDERESATTHSVEDLVKEVAEKGVVSMQLGTEDYLAETLHNEFADMITDEFRTIAKVLKEWQEEAIQMPNKMEKVVLEKDDKIAVHEGDNMLHTERQESDPGKTRMEPRASESHKFCIHCGEKLPLVAKFCSSCGEKL